MPLLLMAPLVTTLMHGLSVQPQPRRFAPDSAWEYRWVAGSDPEAELFIEPRQLVAIGTRVVVLDAGTRDVHLLDAASGRTLRRLPARGTGPGEFKRPSLLLAAPDGFAILDQAAARMTAFSRDGKPAWDFSVPDAARLAGACIPGGDRVLLSYRRSGHSLSIMDTSGRPVPSEKTRHIPWRTLRPDGPDFAHEHRLGPPGSDGRCAVIPIFGGEWAMAGPLPQPPTVHRFAEPGELPRIRQARRILERTATHVIMEGAEISSTRPVAADVMRRGDTVLVVATPVHAPKRRVLDYYEASTGRYLHSRRLPALFTAIALGPDGTFYAAHIGERTQVVAALRPARRVSPPVRREGRRAPPPPSPPARFPAIR